MFDVFELLNGSSDPLQKQSLLTFVSFLFLPNIFIYTKNDNYLFAFLRKERSLHVLTPRILLCEWQWHLNAERLCSSPNKGELSVSITTTITITTRLFSIQKKFSYCFKIWVFAHELIGFLTHCVDSISPHF